MRIDQSHRGWAIATAILFIAALVSYVIYARFFRHGITGGSLAGLIFGIIGYALMIYAALLSLRKKYTRWRVGRAQTWMRGHLWLGLLSYPLILFHGGLSFGHGLTFALMLFFSLVIITGIAGAVLQHYMPRMITERVAQETIYYQIERVEKQLAEEADALLGSLFRKDAQYGLLVPSAEKTATTLVALSEQSGDNLRQAYQDSIKPYLAERGAYRHLLNDSRQARAMFAELRALSPEAVLPVVDGLESICEEKRELDRQSRMHRILYAWLLVHVPLSFVLILLGGIHAVMALLYG